MRVLVFGGTTEGHQLSQRLAESGCHVTCCVATEYGRDVLEPVEGMTVRTGRMSEEEMEAEMRGGYDCVVDATHPYAAQVSENIRSAAQRAGLDYQRLLRPSQLTADGEDEDGILWADDAKAAARLIEATEGNVLLTTGSKDLAAFAAIPGYRERLWVRILPNMDSLSTALSLGYPASHIICMQGPFSRRMNVATLESMNGALLVTKDTGKAGGFGEKVAAAREAGARLLVIRRPVKEQGLELEAMLELLTGGRV